ncbi:MAG: Hsp20/alpha crystallin family protein [Gemmatimonadota bacterium]
MAKIVRRESSARFPDLLDWLDTPWSALLPFGGGQTFRVEDFVQDGHYVIRAELPGVDPEKDIEITIEAGTLTIRAERREEQQEAHRSEFRYGSFTRSVTLPRQADTEHITASYDQGILQVDVPVKEVSPEGRKIPVKPAKKAS